MVLRQRPWREWQIILGRYRLHDPPSQPVIENKHPSTDRFVEICWSSIAILLCLFTHLSFYFILFPSFLPWSWFKVNNSNHWISHFTHPHMQIVSVASLLCQCWFQVYLSWCLKSAKSAAKFSRDHPDLARLYLLLSLNFLAIVLSFKLRYFLLHVKFCVQQVQKLLNFVIETFKNVI